MFVRVPPYDDRRSTPPFDPGGGGGGGGPAQHGSATAAEKNLAVPAGGSNRAGRVGKQPSPPNPRDIFVSLSRSQRAALFFLSPCLRSATTTSNAWTTARLGPCPPPMKTFCTRMTPPFHDGLRTLLQEARPRRQNLSPPSSALGRGLLLLPPLSPVRPRWHWLGGVRPRRRQPAPAWLLPGSFLAPSWKDSFGRSPSSLPPFLPSSPTDRRCRKGSPRESKKKRPAVAPYRPTSRGTRPVGEPEGAPRLCSGGMLRV